MRQTHKMQPKQSCDRRRQQYITITRELFVRYANCVKNTRTFVHWYWIVVVECVWGKNGRAFRSNIFKHFDIVEGAVVYFFQFIYTYTQTYWYISVQNTKCVRTYVCTRIFVYFVTQQCQWELARGNFNLAFKWCIEPIESITFFFRIIFNVLISIWFEIWCL